ncbi:MAG TPA: D-sedoheptulose 7-phosphate isomerase [Candidatus Nitrosotalea sp.]|nr:D-sedoheptulose 7-phosphate isomerase [Candidatus Nitrosotalea sp.]
MESKRDKIIKDTIVESILVKQKVSEELNDVILDISMNISKVLAKKGTVYFFGNGGSAADAQHVAAEFVGRFSKDRRPLPAEALTTNTSILTAVGNDYDFTQVFSRQVKAKVHPNDIVIGISTSGKSKNVINGLEAAKKIGAMTVGFTGAKPNLMDKVSDICLCVPSKITPRIQEAHIMIWHIISDLVERDL